MGLVADNKDKPPTQAAPEEKGAAPSGKAEPLYALVCLSPTRVKMAARRILPKQKYDCPPFGVMLVNERDRDRFLTPSRNPLGGSNPLHVWSRLFHATLGLDIAAGDKREHKDDQPVDPEKFARKFRRLRLEEWCPIWLPQGVPTVTRKQAMEWLKNYGVGSQLYIEAYVGLLENESDGVPDAPNKGKARVQDLDKVKAWTLKRLRWIKIEESRGVGIKEVPPPFGRGSRAERRAGGGARTLPAR